MTDPAATMVMDPIATGDDDALALVAAGDRRTWAELRREAMAVAAGLARHGVTSGARVGVLATPGASVAAIHAIRVAGGVLVPLDARLGEPELRDRIQRAGRTLLLHDAPHADVASSLATSRTGITSLDLATAGVSEGAAELPPLDTAALAALVPTSGTTTRARLVRLDHAALLASADAWNGWLGATSADPWLAAMPLTHVAGLGMVLRAARTGACLHVHDRFDVERIGETLATAGIRFLSVVPTQLRRVLDAGVMPGPTLRALLLGGAPIPHDLVTRALDAGWPVVATYGLTEAASAVTALPVAEARDGAGSSGRPLPAMQVRIVAPDGSQAPTSTDGAIEVSGPSVMAGYEDDPVATSAALHDGWLRTGDIGRLDVEGRLWVLDRRDDLIVSGGENVSPAAVEAVIADHEGVDDAGVVGWPDPRWGARPAAAVVLASDAPVGTLATIGNHVRHRLGPWHAPAWVAQVSAIPRTPSGKAIRPGIRESIVTGHRDRWVERPDGARIHVRETGSGPLVVLLHATLSTARQLDPLADALAPDHRVLAVDRRSAGESRMPADDPLGPVDVAIHLEDLRAVVSEVAPGEPLVVAGHSFGGCVAMELAARAPGQAVGVWAWEPPYLDVLPDPGDLDALGERIARLGRTSGMAAAALAFLAAVEGPTVVERLPEALRDAFAAEGRGAVADAALLGFQPDALAAITIPVELGIGTRAGGPYAAVADALVSRVPGLTVHRFDGLGHGAPTRRPAIIADAIRDLGARCGLHR